MRRISLPLPLLDSSSAGVGDALFISPTINRRLQFTVSGFVSRMAGTLALPDTRGILPPFQQLDCLEPHQKLYHFPLCISYSGKQVGASFQEVSFLFLIPLTLVIECPATV